MNPEAPITLGQAKVLATTPKAIMVSFQTLDDDIEAYNIDDTESFWIPSSCIHEDSDCRDGGAEGTLVVKSWWAARVGLIDDGR